MMALSIRWSSLSGLPLLERGPPGSPSWPNPPHDTRAHSAPNMRLSSHPLVKETFPPWRLSLGSALNCSPHSPPPTAHGGQALLACASFQWPSQCLWLPWSQAKSSQTFAVKAHTTDVAPCTKHSKVWKCKYHGLAGYHFALNPVFPN